MSFATFESSGRLEVKHIYADALETDESTATFGVQQSATYSTTFLHAPCMPLRPGHYLPATAATVAAGGGGGGGGGDSVATSTTAGLGAGAGRMAGTVIGSGTGCGITGGCTTGAVLAPDGPAQHMPDRLSASVEIVNVGSEYDRTPPELQTNVVRHEWVRT